MEAIAEVKKEHKGGWPKGKPRKTPDPLVISIAVIRDTGNMWKLREIHSKGNKILDVIDSEPNLKGIVIQRYIDTLSSM